METVFSKQLQMLRKQSGITQEQLADKLGVTAQAVSKWENGLSVPDSDLLIFLAEELDTSVNALLGETIQEQESDDLKTISEKLEIINLQLAKRTMARTKVIRWGLLSLCALIVIVYVVLAAMKSSYLGWDYSNPELAVAGTILHGFEFIFARLAPIVLLVCVVGVMLTWRKR